MSVKSLRRSNVPYEFRYETRQFVGFARMRFGGRAQSIGFIIMRCSSRRMAAMLLKTVFASIAARAADCAISSRVRRCSAAAAETSAAMPSSF